MIMVIEGVFLSLGGLELTGTRHEELGSGALGDIDPLNKVPFKRARNRVQKGYPLRGLPNDTT